ncbi:hypothetical protein [Pseudoalteromonas nigrifaciens]
MTKKVSMVKKFIRTAIATAAILALSGCATSPKEFDFTPKAVNESDSFAMQVLKSSYNPGLLFDMKDTELPEDSYQNVLDYGTSSAIGLMAGGALGALKGLGWAALFNASSHPHLDYIHYIAYVPADDIDITDYDAINSYIKKNYLYPALESYVASDENKKLERPVEILDYANGDFQIKGDACYALPYETHDNDTCQMFWNQNTLSIRYATAETGLPFTPSVKANRYIVARIVDLRLRSSVLLKHIKTDMMYAFVPGLGYRTEHLSQLTDNIIFEDTPSIIGKDASINFFITKKK